MTRAADVLGDGSLARALFAPRAVALIGASSDPGKTTARPLRYLRKHGFEGRVFPIHPTAATVGGTTAYPDLASVPEPVDHAFILLAAPLVPAAVRACAEAGVRCVTVLSDGFAETGPEGLARQRALVETARAHGVRLLGPNSIGVVDTDGFACSANAALEMPELPRAGYGVISQSGSMIGALLSQGAARGIGFSSLVSVGNECDLSVGEIGELMLADPRCTAILLFLEAIRDRAALARFARAAEAAGKPVLACKLGRSTAGQALAATHTGALSGDDRSAEALFRHLGIARVNMLETLYEAPPLFFGSGRPEGGRVAVVTTTGGGGALVVDALASNGLDIAAVPATVRARLERQGVSVGQSGLIDLTLAGTGPEVVRDVLDLLMAAEGVDAVAMVIGSSAQFRPDLAVAPLHGLAESPKPLAIHLVPAAERSRAMLSAEGLAVFRTAESCAEGLRARLQRRAPGDVPATPAEGLAERVAAEVAGAAGAALDEPTSRRICDLLGIEGPPGRCVRTPDEARAAFAELGGAAVLKIVSPDIPHKSDSGGILLGIDTPEAAARGVAQLLQTQRAAHPGADLRGVLIQKMARGVGEALIGFRRDPQSGPFVMLGAGGVLAEVMDDIAIRVAPVDLDTAREMIAEVRMFRAFAGYRGAPKGDLEAVARAVVSLSRLARCPEVAEAEINPFLIGAEGAGGLALDALVVAAERP
ncbi:acetate--CoA ligase family protein [Salipiger mucosus]|uniref:Acetyl-CoA synthetase n=1 Tax=Salipiger mucosus DSM 16094 TaxID=1123237 RepID=S9Q9I8_9RHOB|nr:acetate--CoA ligase family protein [Salipiger mucosus]EPX76627.1 Acetyl-CoA synthetase [Salipiger mucosus DSM 16094]